MATPEPLYLQVAEDWAVHEQLWNRAQAPDSPGGESIVPAEIVEINRHRIRSLSRRIPLLTATVQVMTGLGRSQDGIDGKRFERTCRERWGRRNDGSNVIDLYPRVPLDAA